MIKQNISLKEFSNYKIGGPAEYFLEVKSKKELIEGLKEWHALLQKLKVKKGTFVLGGGTNLLISDNGFDGLIIYNNIRFIRPKGDTVVFGSGLPLAEAVDYFTQKSLTGLEWAGGLPGTVGGAIRGNAGAFGSEIKDIVIGAESINLDTLEKIERSNSECHFNYRTSVFKESKAIRELILTAALRTRPGDRTEIAAQVQSKIDYRQEHQPLDYPSLGSTFKNIPCSKAPKEMVKKYHQSIKNDPFPVIPVSRLLSDAGLKGKRVGGAEISEKHPNFIINRGNAKAGDVLALIKLAQETVRKKFNVKIEPEIKYLERLSCD